MNCNFTSWNPGKKLVVLFLAVLMPFMAAAQKPSASLSFDRIPLKDAIEKVEKAYGIYFVYNNKSINDKVRVSVNKKNVSLTTMLDAMLSNTEINYSIEDGQVILVKQGTAEATAEQQTPNTLTGVVRDTQSSLGSLNSQPGYAVKGTVRDENGAGLPGAAVVVKDDPTKYAISGLDGSFDIQNVPTNATLSVTFMGYEDVEIQLNGRNNVSVQMESSNIKLDQVMVTGYQTISRDRATGSYDILSGAVLEKPTSNIGSSLIGNVSGVQATADMEGNLKFEIRGKTSFSTNAEPLVVVDGFPIEAGINAVNPNDVETITVLKDAAAASIWGARSANGVIVITTKSGKKDLKAGKQTTVDVSSFVKIAPKIDVRYARSLASSAETLLYEELGFNNWSPALASPIQDGFNSGAISKSVSPGYMALNEHYLGYITEAEMQQIRGSLANLDNTNQIKKYLIQNQMTHQYNVNINTVTDRQASNMSAMYEGKKLHLKGEEDWKAQFGYRTNVNLTKWLDFNFSGNVLYQQNSRNSDNRIKEGGNNAYSALPSLSPYEMLVDENGNRIAIGNMYYMPNVDRYVDKDAFPYSDFTYNPITEMENTRLKTNHLNLRFQGGFTFKIIQGLTFDSKVQYELNNSQYRGEYTEDSFLVRRTVNSATQVKVDDDGKRYPVQENLAKGGFLDQQRSKMDVWILRNQVNFNRTFATRHSVSFIGGLEFTDRTKQRYDYPRTYGYNNNTLNSQPFPNGTGSSTNNSLKITDWFGNNLNYSSDFVNKFKYNTDRFVSIYGNASYTFDDKYTVSGSARNDASNLITDDPKYRYSPFWSVGASWQIGKEEFMANAAWVDRLNLRVTYGFNGNVDTSTAFKPLISMGSTVHDNTQEPYATISSYGNPTLRWEKTGTWDVGVDYSFFGGRLFGKLDLYNKSGKDLIAKISIPAVNGTTSQSLNSAAITNRGFEFEVGTVQRILNNDIVWRGNFNISYNKNKVTDFFVSSYTQSGTSVIAESTYVEGYDANTLWAMVYAGVENKGTAENPNWQPVVKGPNGTTYDFNQWAPGNQLEYCVPMGTMVAPWTLGFSNSFKIYDFDLSFIMTAKMGHKYRTRGFKYDPVSGRALPNNKLSEVLNGDPQKIVPLPYNHGEEKSYFWDRYTEYLDYNVLNAGLIRMNEINLTYTLPYKLLKKGRIDRLQVYAQVNNPFNIYFNKYNEDPEYPQGSFKPTAYYTFGLKLQF